MKTTESTPAAGAGLPPDHPSLADQIAGHPFTRGMSRELVAHLADFAMESRFAAGETIFQEGDPANRFYLIQEGKVALESYIDGRGLVSLQTVGPGDVLGWSWLFPPYYWHFDARALEPTRAIFLYGTPLRERCEENHDLGFELYKRLADVVVARLQATRRLLLECRRNQHPAA